MMLLGLVLHCACNYQNSAQDFAWNFRDSQNSGIFTLMVGFIHAWRMPIFMFIGGFFGALLVEKRGHLNFAKNRLIRLGGPLLIFLPLLVPLTISGFVFANFAKGMGIDAAWIAVQKTPAENLFLPITIHLWFVYYLLIYSICAFFITSVTQSIPDSFKPGQLMSRIIAIPGSSLLLALPLAWALMDSFLPGLLMVGINLIPETTSFLTYGFVYFCGWSAWNRRDLLERVATWPRIIFSLSTVALLFLGWGAMIENPETYSSAPRKFLASFLAGWMIWLAIWGFIGLFAKLTAREIPVIRYLVDSSYWLYVLHLPFTIWIPGYMVIKDWGSFPKFGISLALTTLIGLVTYDLFVRSTWIGVLLNGRRAPRTIFRTSNRPQD